MINYRKKIIVPKIIVPEIIVPKIIVPKIVETYTEKITIEQSRPRGGVREIEFELEMVILPEGSFLMGSDESGTEKPIHQVTLKQFAIAKYPVTQEQYKAIMGDNPSSFKPSKSKDNPKNPVDSISWEDAQSFCLTLNQKTGKNYRLPSQSEWEYACRAGTQTHYYFGDDEKHLGEYAWYGDNSDSKTHPVGQKKPNHWGLYDMSGNVWEWCEDSLHGNYQNAPSDGSAWNDNHSSSSSKMLRGGAWNCTSWSCRSARNFHYLHKFSYNKIGFRLAISLP